MSTPSNHWQMRGWREGGRTTRCSCRMRTRRSQKTESQCHGVRGGRRVASGAATFSDQCTAPTCVVCVRQNSKRHKSHSIENTNRKYPLWEMRVCVCVYIDPYEDVWAGVATRSVWVIMCRHLLLKRACASACQSHALSELH